MSRNVGVYRMQVKGRNKLAIQPIPQHDIAIHLTHAEERGEDLPVAITVSNEPIILLVSLPPSANRIWRSRATRVNLTANHRQHGVRTIAYGFTLAALVLLGSAGFAAADEVRLIHDLTSGWPASVQLLAIMLNGAWDILRRRQREQVMFTVAGT